MDKDHVYTIENLHASLGTPEERRRNIQLLKAELFSFLVEHGYKIVPGNIRANILNNELSLLEKAIFIETRVKTDKSILAKIARFGEKPEDVLDVYGFRIICTKERELDEISSLLLSLWKKPTKKQMTLRGGKLIFPAFRDYRLKDFAGRTSATAVTYDEAIHLNRSTPYGITEIQIQTQGLFKRSQSQDSEASHTRYKKRYNKLLN